MEFFSEQLVSSDYCNRLARDMQQAEVCRFLVAYISSVGIDAIGRNELIRALRDERSFGIGSLTCSCGYSPLVDLQSHLGDSLVRLKYFMDPRSRGTDEPDDIVLFHSKLVYLYLAEARKSVVYIGSHNWSSRALGPGSPRNVEASIRFEAPFDPEHLEGVGPSIASEVNRHLLSAFSKPPCLEATSNNRDTFDQWYQWTCEKSPPLGLDRATVIVAVLSRNGANVSPQQWAQLAGQSVYMPVLEESEGRQVRAESDRIFVMVWESLADLASGNQPVLLVCHLSTQDPGPRSEVRGTNRSLIPIAGFRAVLFDQTQFDRQMPRREQIRMWSGRQVRYFDFEFPTGRTDSSAVDAGVQPLYRFLLEVDHVVFPKDGVLPNDPAMLWSRESFAVAKSKDSARLARIPGYFVGPSLKERILDYLTQELGVDTARAKSLPVSEYDMAQEGKRISSHPLHEAFIGPQARQQKDQFYENTSRGSLVADFDSVPQRQIQSPAPQEKPLERVERLFTMKLDKLTSVWLSAAQAYRSSTR